MGTDQGDAQEKVSDSRPPYLKLRARDSLGDGPKGTSTWSILKDLKISLVDGGVSILKQGISKLTGAVSGVDLLKEARNAPTPVNISAQADGAIGTAGTIDNGGHVAAEPLAVGNPAIEDEQAAFGFDWLDNLLEDLDASKPIPGEEQISTSRALTGEAQGGLPLNLDGKDPSVPADGESEESPLFPPL